MENRTETRMDMVPFVFNDNMVRGCLDDRGEPWFVARDVAAVLDLQNIRQNLESLDEDEKITVCNPDGNPRAGIPHQYAMVSESGLYALIFRSRKPEARRFRKWVTAEVLPALRKKGHYARPGSVFGVDGVPGAALGMKPRMRKDVMTLAVRMAALDNGGTDEAVYWFREISDMIGAETPPAMSELSAEAGRQVEAFAEQCLSLAPGRKESAAMIYRAYLRWWDERQGKRLTLCAFGRALGRVYPKTKDSTIWYMDVRLKSEYR